MERRRRRRVVVMPGGGLCFGVKRAVDAVLRAEGSVAALGELAHNPKVMEDLHRAGVRIIDSPEDLMPGETVIVRSHGVSPDVMSRLEEVAGEVVDATCPRVRRAQKAASDAAGSGWPVVVVGSASHPEVEGVVGHAGPGTTVVSNVDEALKLPHLPRRAVVFQTTFDPSSVEGVIEALRRVTDHLKVHDTLCPVVADRRQTVARLASEVEAVIVVGGSNSSNTAALAQVVKKAGTPVYSVERAKGLPMEELQAYESLAVIGGTSTPLESLEEVAGCLSGCCG
ncbi:MAG: 4-hydroxy-3-methylbut-2-enyl diphosphate reductase [Clostridia bacterium]